MHMGYDVIHETICTMHEPPVVLAWQAGWSPPVPVSSVPVSSVLLQLAPLLQAAPVAQAAVLLQLAPLLQAAPVAQEAVEG